MSANIDLPLIAAINTRISAIITRSEKIYMIALNAMFLSKKSTAGMGGFSSVTAQLRGFSRTLSKRMEDLRRQTSELSTTVAENRKLLNYNRIVENIDKLANGELTLHKNLRESITLARGESEHKADLLQKELLRLEKLIGVGQNLTVLAKVEATNTGSISDMLMSISSDMDDAIAEIDRFISTSMKQLKAA